MKKRLNPMLFVAGIGVGVFVYSMFLASRESNMDRALDQAALNGVLATDDVSELRARLAASQNRVARLESMISMATAAENKLQQIKDPENADENKISDLSTLIDRSKPLLRQLILPELEKSMADDDFGGDFELSFWSDLLELDSNQQTLLQRELDALARERSEMFIDQLKDDDTSMFALFNQMSDFENIADPEVDTIYANHLDSDQLGKYEDERLEQRVKKVDAEAANGLDRINYHIPDLDEKQQDAIYVVLSRSSKAYTPEMQIATGDDVSNDNSPLDGEQRSSAIEQILQPHQRSDWATYRNREALLSGIGQ
jgi:hypothetical protein|tara:strand:+ start:5353 stop:6294 length:942 start_codon:yes stop_codon:yes gene_type:complete